MTNKPKNIGTWTETQALKAAKASGFPDAERKVLHGAKDVADLWLLPSDAPMQIIVEVKGGHAAENATPRDIERWWHETQLEMWNVVNATGRGAIGLLVVKRKGVGGARAAEWWAYADLGTLDGLRGGWGSTSGLAPMTGSGTIVRMLYGDALSIAHRTLTPDEEIL